MSCRTSEHKWPIDTGRFPHFYSVCVSVGVNCGKTAEWMKEYT